jgi:hypothetical protein
MLHSNAEAGLALVARPRNSRRPGLLAAWRQHLLGAVVASGVLAGLLFLRAPEGMPVPPSLTTARFQVAVLQGPRQAEQSAPADAENKVDAVKPAPAPKSTNTVAVAQRSTSLPKAVKAAQDADPGTEVASPVDVMPPARVSMPGGKLAVEDAPEGDQPDPFAIGPKQVYIRLFVDANGHVDHGGIVREGSDPIRDAIILKSMFSRTYSTKNLPRVGGPDQLWQLDMVINYSGNEFLP